MVLPERPVGVNLAGLTRADYRGAASTFVCRLWSQFYCRADVAASYEINLVPEKVIKFSGIGCSSKSPTYFLSRSFGLMACMGACLHWHPERCLAIII